MKIKLAVFLVLIFGICRAGADDISDYVNKSKKEAIETKKKLSSKDGIFNDNNYSGTLIREARPEDRAPASADLSVGSN